MAIGVTSSSFGRYSTSHNRAPKARVLLCGLVLGLFAMNHAQPAASFMLDTTCVPGRDYSTTWATAADFGDSLGLVVWVGGSVSGVQGCRVRQDMSVVDSVCLDISGPDHYASVYEQHAVDVAWSGENYLVVWLDGTDVCGAIVSPQGEIVRRVVISDSAYNWVSVASDGSGFLVEWWEVLDDVTLEMYRLLSREGEPVDSARRVTQSGGSQSYGDVEFAGNCYMLAFWRSDSQGNNPGLSVVRIRPDGSILDSVPIPVRDGPISTLHAVGRIADNFCVVWGERQDSIDIRVARVSQSGVVLDSAGVVVGRDSAISHLCSTSSGDTCLLAWRSYARESGYIKALRTDELAHPLDSLNLTVSSVAWAPAPPVGVSALSASDFAVIWCQLQFPVTNSWNHRDVVCRRVSSSGVLLDSTDLGLSYAANTQLGNDVASDGESFLAVWQDWTGLPLTSRLHMKRFTSDGTLLDSAWIPVGDSDAQLGALAYGPGCYLVCWRDPTNWKIEAARVGRDGVVLDTVPILVSQCSSRPGEVDVAYGDSMFLVVWYRGGSGVFGARVRADGVVLDSVARRVTNSTYFCFRPRVASDGLNFLVTYNGGSQGLYAVRVDSAGHPMDPTDTYLGDIPGDDWSAPVVFGRGFYLAYDWGGSRAWRISPANGQVLNSLRNLSLDEQSTISFDGRTFLINGTWDYRVVAAQRISPQGELLDATPFVLATFDTVTSSIWSYDGCAAGSTGNLGLMFTAYERPRYMSYRVRGAACPALGILEERNHGQSYAGQIQTIVHRTLFLPEVSSGESQTAILLDAAGRRLRELHPGPNDVRGLAPGVYFVREQRTNAEPYAQPVRKVVIAK